MTGEFHGQRSLAGYGPRDLTELDKTEATLHACRERRELKPEIRDQQEQNTHCQHIPRLKGVNSAVSCLESLDQISLCWELTGGRMLQVMGAGAGHPAFKMQIFK